MKTTLLVLGLAAACALGACGKQGELDRPEPLFGAAKENDYDKNRPPTPQENIDPASTNRSPRAAPATGTNDPFGAPPSLTP
jgi:hypothetical protein